MKSEKEIRERLKFEIQKPLTKIHSFEYGKCRGWIDALRWILSK